MVYTTTSYSRQALFLANILAAEPVPQHRIHGVEQIGPHHTDFINHQQIKTLDNPFFFLLNLNMRCRFFS